jgi:valyl-tRNA synthetase
MHPIMPFITETIWQRVVPLTNFEKTGDSIMIQSFPQFDQSQCDQTAIDDLEWVKQFVVAIRNIRGEMDITPSKPLPVLLKHVNADDQRRLNENEQFISALAKLESITLLSDDDKGPASATAIVGDLSILIPMAGLIDKDAELARLDKAIDKLSKDADRVRAKLNNESFVGKAPEAVINKEKAKLADAESTLAKMVDQKVQIAEI